MKTTDDPEMLKECSKIQSQLIKFIDLMEWDDNMCVNAMLSLCFGRIYQYVDTPQKLREGVIWSLESFIDKFCQETDT